MTDKLREAWIAEAKRRSNPCDPKDDYASLVAENLLDLIQADWRPEPEVDAVTLAAREWMVGNGSITTAAYIHDGNADQSTFADAFRAGHAHALSNCADVRRMDWLARGHLDVLDVFSFDPDDIDDHEPLRTKIDRAMGGGE